MLTKGMVDKNWFKKKFYPKNSMHLFTPVCLRRVLEDFSIKVICYISLLKLEALKPA